MSYGVFYLVHGVSNWGFHSSGHPTLETAEQSALECMKRHGSNINTIRVVQLIYEGKPYEGKPRETTTVTWK